MPRPMQPCAAETKRKLEGSVAANLAAAAVALTDCHSRQNALSVSV